VQSCPVQTNLTASRKKRFRHRATRPGVEWLDAMNKSCRALETLGLALAVTAEQAEAMPPELGAGLGELILREVEAVRDLTGEARKAAR